MFHEVPEEETPPAVRRLMELAGPEFLEALQAIGIYVEARAITAQDEEATQVALVLAGNLGDVAFSDRVLNPQVVSDEDVLEDITDATVAAEFEANRRRLLGLPDE